MYSLDKPGKVCMSWFYSLSISEIQSPIPLFLDISYELYGLSFLLSFLLSFFQDLYDLEFWN